MREIMDLIELEKCKKDVLYLTSDVQDWKNKRFLQSAILSHLTHYPFNYNYDTAVRAYEELMGEI